MMNEIMERDSITALSLDELGQEVRFLTRQAKSMVLSFGVEIGRRLRVAHDKCEHGQWATWVKEQTEFSQTTANRFIRLFEEYGAAQNSLFGAETNCATLNNLSISNALRLLAVPEEDREKVAIELDAEHISTRQLDEALKARAEAEKRAKQAEEELKEAAERAAEAEGKAFEADELADRLREELRKEREKPVEIAVQEPTEEQIREKAALLVAEAERTARERERTILDKLSTEQTKLETLKKKLADTEQKAAEDKKKAVAEALKESEEKIQMLETAKAQFDEARKADMAAAEKKIADMAAERDAAQKKLASAGGEVQAFNAYLQSAMNAMNSAMGILAKMEEGEQKTKLKAAMGALGTKIAGMAGG